MIWLAWIAWAILGAGVIYAIGPVGGILMAGIGAFIAYSTRNNVSPSDTRSGK